MGKENLIVSACLLGVNCKYNGRNNKLDDCVINKIKDKYNIISVCPEQLGGLPTPRYPSEIKECKVISKDGTDVSKEFEKGAVLAVEKAEKNKVKIALLKRNSPSCGNDGVYDGTFTKTLVEGFGVTAKLMSKKGIIVINEEEIDDLF